MPGVNGDTGIGVTGSGNSSLTTIWSTSTHLQHTSQSPRQRQLESAQGWIAQPAAWGGGYG